MIRLNKTLINDRTGQSVDFWEVVEINENLKAEKVIIVIRGYATREARNNGLDPLRGASKRFVVVNPDKDDQGSFIGRPDYNRWKNFKLSDADLLDNAVVKAQRLQRAQVKDFLSTIPDFADATDD